MNPGKAILRGELRRMRALMLLRRKLTSGLSNTELGKEFGISKDTVERSLTFAQKSELLADFERELFRDLVPQAMTAARNAMRDGNAVVALEILKGAGVLKKQPDKSSGGTDGDDLELYIRAKRSNNPTGAPSPVAALGPVLAGFAGAAQGAPAIRAVDDLHRLPAGPRVVGDTVTDELVDTLEGELVGTLPGDN